ncbi:hypothetical protein CLOM_g22655 [Closterium sp. NIES-68]|nr:hypothetical protein CLOM_g22655 [Closterium sp. NIES-68]
MNERGGDANGRGAVPEKASEPPPSKVEALDGSNYEEWSGRMRSAFKRYKLLKIAVGEEKMPEEGEARERWIEKSAVLFDLILQSVNKEMFEHIKDLVEADDSGPRAWKLLRDVIQPNTLPMVIVLEKELAAISMRPGDDVKPVLDKIKDTYARMAAAGSSVSQLQQCTKIISVLDNSWDNLIPTLNSQQDQWTPEWLRHQILQEDFRRRHVGGGAATKTAEGYGAAGRGRGRGGWRGRGRGRSFGRGRGRGDYNEGHGSSSGRGSTRMEGTCWYCKKVGHPWFKCFSRPEGWAPPGMKPPSGERAQGGAVQGSGAQGEGAQGNAYPGMYLMVEDVHGHEGDVGSVGKVVMHPLTHWVIDSGCTSHMTPRADLLDEVKPPGKIKYVAAASGALLPVIGIGNAKVKGANGELVGLGNVLLVEGLSANLLSLRRLQKSKAEVTFGPTSCRAKLGKKKLVKNGSLKGLEVKGEVKEIGSCPTCLETKFSKFPFNSTTGPAKTPLALVHMDVVGPTRAPSLSGSRYFLTIVDDHTRAVWPCADEEVVGESDRKLFHSMVGSLNYAANHTRPDIAFATSRLASVVSRPSHEQLEAAKRLVRYVSATASVGLEYSGVRQRLQRGAADVKSGEMLLSCYTDASFNSVKADGTSIGGYVCLLGGGAVSWRSKKQNEVGLSSCETEYMALHHGAKEVVWLRRLLEELGVGQEEPTVVFCDNESAVKLAKNACLHGLTKHIRPKWHWVRRLLDKEVRLEIVKTHQQAADIFTKRLAEADHWKGMKLAGMSVH